VEVSLADRSARIGGTRGEMEPDEALAGLLVTYMLNRSLPFPLTLSWPVLSEESPGLASSSLLLSSLELSDTKVYEP